MTREEILAMKPGRELDALVAKNVMGWKYSQVSPDTKKFYCLISGNNKGWWKAPDWKGWGCASCGEEPHEYSTDISAAWEVVEKAKIAIIPQCGAPEDMSYCAWVEEGPFSKEIKVFSLTAPEAIVKAALIAYLEG